MKCTVLLCSVMSVATVAIFCSARAWQHWNPRVRSSLTVSGKALDYDHADEVRLSSDSSNMSFPDLDEAPLSSDSANTPHLLNSHPASADIASAESFPNSRVAGNTRYSDDCPRVYLDVGANKGIQVRKLFQPSAYPNAPVHEIFNKYFGPAKTKIRKDVCAIGFEANPQFKHRLGDLERAYAIHGWRTKFFVPRAVSNTSVGNVTLFGNGGHGLGASVVFHSRNRWSGKTRYTVPNFDLTEFLESDIFQRQWKQEDVKPVVVMKLDIEGSEFLVLPKMLDRGQLCSNRINAIYMEWHESMYKDGVRLRKELEKRIDDPSRCPGSTPTAVIELDDELYAYYHFYRNGKFQDLPLPWKHSDWSQGPPTRYGLPPPPILPAPPSPPKVLRR